jgi:hypothetical protein
MFIRASSIQFLSFSLFLSASRLIYLQIPLIKTFLSADANNDPSLPLFIFSPFPILLSRSYVRGSPAEARRELVVLHSATGWLKISIVASPQRNSGRSGCVTRVSLVLCLQKIPLQFLRMLVVVSS